MRTPITATVMLATGTLLLAGCGEDQDRPDHRPAHRNANADLRPTEPPRMVRVDPGPAPVPVRLTRAQQRAALRIAKSDPAVRELVGHGAEFGRPFPWSRTNQEPLGAAIQVKLSPARDYDDAVVPTIENEEELYGEGYDQEGGGEGNVEPGIRPEIGLTELSAEGVSRLFLMVDLRAGRVAAIKLAS